MATRDRREHDGCPYLATEEPMPDGRVRLFCKKCGLYDETLTNGSLDNE